MELRELGAANAVPGFRLPLSKSLCLPFGESRLAAGSPQQPSSPRQSQSHSALPGGAPRVHESPSSNRVSPLPCVPPFREKIPKYLDLHRTFQLHVLSVRAAGEANVSLLGSALGARTPLLENRVP